MFASTLISSDFHVFPHFRCLRFCLSYKEDVNLPTYVNEVECMECFFPIACNNALFSGWRVWLHRRSPGQLDETSDEDGPLRTQPVPLLLVPVLSLCLLGYMADPEIQITPIHCDNDAAMIKLCWRYQLSSPPFPPINVCRIDRYDHYCTNGSISLNVFFF